MTLDSPGGPRRSRRVLIVDDNEDAAEWLAELIRLEGHLPRVAHDGESALAAADAFDPEVVLLDLGLPVVDGYEVARRLRRHPRLGAVVIVAVTGYGQPADRLRSQAAGFDGHLVKPIAFEDLAPFLA